MKFHAGKYFPITVSHFPITVYEIKEEYPSEPLPLQRGEAVSPPPQIHQTHIGKTDWFN